MATENDTPNPHPACSWLGMTASAAELARVDAAAAHFVRTGELPPWAPRPRPVLTLVTSSPARATRAAVVARHAAQR